MTRIRDVLTTRGRAFVAAGLTLLLAGMALGFADLSRIGVLLVSLALLAGLSSRRGSPELTVSRTVHPARLTVDQVATVEVEFANASRRRTPMLMAEERVDYALGDRPRFVLPRMGPGERREVTYDIRSHVRGRHRLGPLSLRVRDPFGLATIALALSGTCEVLVLPRVEPLTGGRPGGEGIGAEGVIPHMVALHGEDDVSIREYRDGDDLRRIHWPATAHQGELMVRQEDRPARRRAVLVLDSRASGHRGSGPSGSFEWAVSAIASTAVHLATQGYSVHLVSSESVTGGRSAEVVDIDAALESLAVAETGRDPAFEEVLHAAHPLASSGGLVIAVATDHDEESLRNLATLRQPGGTALLMLLQAATFAQGPGSTTVSPRTDALADLARTAGWSARVVRSGDAIAEAWAAVSASSSPVGADR